MNEIYSGTNNLTLIHPVGLFAVVVLGICVILLPRRWSILPLLIVACFIPTAQRLVVFGLDFNFLRLLVLFGMTRLVIRKESQCFSWNPIDITLLLWVVSSTLIYTVQVGTLSALINRLGFGFDAFGMYYLFRCLVREWSDVDTIVLGCIVISLPIVVFFILENRTGRNLFSLFGGVPEITSMRDGRLRCQGAFSHAILAGCFWAALMPLVAARWWRSAKDKAWAVVGLITSLIVVICCASSTPVFGILCGVIGGIMFYTRRYMRQIRWGILLALISLHIVMKAPVWHLISRVSAVGGSTGWHRYNLINQAVNHFGEWCFMGCPEGRVVSWGVSDGDVTNQYILEGIRGGLLTMVLFFCIISLAFQAVGRMWRRYRDPYRIALSWAMGVSLFIHCMNFIGVSYFGQIHIIWYLLLAIIGSLDSCSASIARTSFRPQHVPTIPHSSRLG
jgi:hypothetical protein